MLNSDCQFNCNFAWVKHQESRPDISQSLDKIKVLLFAMTGFGNEVFRALCDNPLCELIGVVSPKKPQNPSPYYDCKHLHDEVLARGVSLYEDMELKDDSLVASLLPDLIITATFNKILPISILEIPPYGIINLHPSLLPKYRGATPTTWAIYNGERQTGVTAHIMTEHIDKGDIILQRTVNIDINDTDGILRRKLAILAGEMTGDIINMIVNGNLSKGIQDEKMATYFPKRSSSPLILSELVDSNIQLHNKIRSHLPYPGVQILHRGGYVNVISSFFDLQADVLAIEGKDKIMYRGKNITLRPFEKRDIETYRQWVNDPEIAALVDRILPVSELEHERWYGSIQQNQNAVVFAIDENSNSKYIGNVWLWDVEYRHRKAEVRILIGDSEGRGKGYGSEALEMISWFAFNKMNLHKLYAYVLSSNVRAKRAFERAGFSEEGLLRQDRFVNGRYEDVFLMGKIDNENKETK